MDCQELKKDVNFILDKMQKDFGKPEISKSALVQTLRQTFLRSEVVLPHRWSFSAYSINYELDEILERLGFKVINNGRATYITRLIYIDPCERS
jgi:hypothetical protein